MTSGPGPIKDTKGHRRADIQGLRAVAVAAVIANHLFDWPRGGFLGVDAFFVVSGFVITGVLLRERDRSGHTSLRGFWARRARRILPLALIVLAATVAAARWAYAPAKAAGIQTDALWAALFGANWHFAQVGTDYFQQGQAPSPVQHFWSLGVEEQFYLVWPWVLALAAVLAGARSARRGRIAVALVAALVAVASVAWAVVQTPSDATTAYYSSLTRAWEIAAGALLATLPGYAVRLPSALRSALSWAGLAGLVASFAVVGPDAGVPYPAAVAPVVATLAVLLAGVGAPAPGTVLLSNPVSRYLGDISYGLYLWHFPLVVFVAALVQPGSPLEWATVLVATLVLAAISYHLVERPILDAPRLRAESRPHGGAPAWGAWWRARRRGMVAAGAALVCLVAGVGGAAYADPGAFTPRTVLAAAAENGAVAAPPVPDPTPTTTTTTPVPSPTTTPTGPLVIPLGATGRKVQSGLSRALAAGSWPADLNPSTDQWQTTGNRLAESKGCVASDASDPASCTFGNPSGPEIIVYGDSLGIPLLATVVAAYGKHYKIRGMTKLACAVNGVNANFGQDDWAIPCVRHRKMTVAYVKKVKPVALIMVENYAWSLKLRSGASGRAAGREWLKADQAFVNSVKSSVDHVVILGPSMPGVAFLDCYRPGGSPGRCVTGIPKWWRTTRDAERKIQDATFVDTTHWYCVDGRCPIFTANTGSVLKGDYLHTSVQYARQLAPDLSYMLSYAGVLSPRP
ncbi:MAG TPA: acyltransferase family protein [Dermatophilaceae bacterium]|nr:acyltransferase family protein [Dermatophilaceae bacterium]